MPEKARCSSGREGRGGELEAGHSPAPKDQGEQGGPRWTKDRLDAANLTVLQDSSSVLLVLYPTYLASYLQQGPMGHRVMS